MLGMELASYHPLVLRILRWLLGFFENLWAPALTVTAGLEEVPPVNSS
jgi:hypothetical protein